MHYSETIHKIRNLLDQLQNDYAKIQKGLQPARIKLEEELFREVSNSIQRTTDKLRSL